MNQLKFWRLERGLSQVELGVASGIPRWNIQLLECGVRCASPDERTALAITLGIGVEKLFSPLPRPESSTEKK